MYSFAVERGLLELLKLAIMGHAIKAKLMFCFLRFVRFTFFFSFQQEFYLSLQPLLL